MGVPLSRQPDWPVARGSARSLSAISLDRSRLTGTYDAIGPVLELGPVLRETAELVGATDFEFVPVDPDTLTEAGINFWGGPTSLPLWLPPAKYGLVAHDPAPALTAGLTPRSLAETVRTALADEHARGLDRPRTAGLTAAEEHALLGQADTTARA